MENKEETHLKIEISAIEEMDTFTDKQSHFLSIQISDPYSLRDSTSFIKYLKMFPLYNDDLSILKKIFNLCMYTEDEIINKNLEKINKLANRSRRVSWDCNLVEIKEIEGREIKKKKLKDNKTILYDYDLQKIEACDKDSIIKIISEISNML